nr:hypothetical protein [Tanacetum cinerariifolium]
KDHFEIVINSNNDYSSNDDDSLYHENIEYVEASPHDSKFVSLEVEKIVIPEDEEIEDDNLREKLLKVNLLIPEIEALTDNPTLSSEFLTKSSSTSPKPFFEGTNIFYNSLPEFENFCFDLEEISSGSTTTHSDISLLEYEAFSFHEDRIEEISSGSTTTHYDLSFPEYDSFIFDLSNDQFPPTDRSDFTQEEFGDELAHIISPVEYDCFYFRNFPDPGELIFSLNSGIRKNLSSTTRVNLPVEDDYSLLLAYVVWIFLAYLTYPIIPPHLHSFENEDTIFDPGITIVLIHLSQANGAWSCWGEWWKDCRGSGERKNGKKNVRSGVAGPVWGCDKLVIRAKVIENQIMAASTIAIAFVSLDESVGSPPSWIILFGDIPTVIPSISMVSPKTSTTAPVISSADPVIETTIVTLPIGLYGLVPYSNSNSNSPDEMDSPEYITSLPATSPFLYTDSPKASDSFDGPPSHDPYAITVAR